MATKNNVNHPEAEHVGLETHYWRNGKMYTRVRHSSINKSTQHQTDNRKSFGARMSVLGHFADAFRYGFSNMKEPGQTAYNAGIRFNTEKAVRNGKVDLDLLKLSQGPLTMAPITRCELNGTALHVEWDTATQGNSNGDDMMLFCVVLDSYVEPEHSQELPMFWYNTRRDAGALDCKIRQDWQHQDLHVYLFAYSEAQGACSDTAMAKIGAE